MKDNVFADLGLPDANELAIKADLAINIVKLIRSRKLTQTQVATLTGWTQPKVSALMNGRLDDISVERLLKVVHALNYSITISIDAIVAEETTATVTVNNYALAATA